MLVHSSHSPPPFPHHHQPSRESFFSSSSSSMPRRHPSLSRSKHSHSNPPSSPSSSSSSFPPLQSATVELTLGLPSFHLTFLSSGDPNFSILVSLLHPHPPIHTPIPTRLQHSPLIVDEASPFHRRSLSGSPPSRAAVLEDELERKLSNVPEEEKGKVEEKPGKGKGKALKSSKSRSKTK